MRCPVFNLTQHYSSNYSRVLLLQSVHFIKLLSIVAAMGYSSEYTLSMRYFGTDTKDVLC